MSETIKQNSPEYRAPINVILSGCDLVQLKKSYKDNKVCVFLVYDGNLYISDANCNHVKLRAQIGGVSTQECAEGVFGKTETLTFVKFYPSRTHFNEILHTPKEDNNKYEEIYTIKLKQFIISNLEH